MKGDLVDLHQLTGPASVEQEHGSGDEQQHGQCDDRRCSPAQQRRRGGLGAEAAVASVVATHRYPVLPSFRSTGGISSTPMKMCGPTSWPMNGIVAPSAARRVRSTIAVAAVSRWFPITRRPPPPTGSRIGHRLTGRSTAAEKPLMPPTGARAGRRPPSGGRRAPRARRRTRRGGNSRARRRRARTPRSSPAAASP